jgi:hypothetical protein
MGVVVGGKALSLGRGNECTRVDVTFECVLKSIGDDAEPGETLLKLLKNDGCSRMVCGEELLIVYQVMGKMAAKPKLARIFLDRQFDTASN